MRVKFPREYLLVRFIRTRKEARQVDMPIEARQEVSREMETDPKGRAAVTLSSRPFMIPSRLPKRHSTANAHDTHPMHLDQAQRPSRRPKLAMDPVYDREFGQSTLSITERLTSSF